MAEHPVGGQLHRLLNVAAARALGGLSDGDLLGRFVGSHEESAFTALIERHGPMVLGVCRRVLPNRHDAEDASQATFLVLARKAGSLRGKASVGGWLHGVASRVAASLKRDIRRRAIRERGACPPAPTNPSDEATWREVQAALDEELGRLPERFRTPLVLCYLECLTRDEAAGRLGLSPGTLHGRLERGRDLLRTRLTRRGLTLPAVMTASALGGGAVHAAPPAFVASSAGAAALLAAGRPLPPGAVGANVLALTREVLTSMFLTKVKLGTAAVLCAALIGGFASLGFAQPKPRESTVTRENPESDADFIRRLSKDLRGTNPTPTEIHFFLASRDGGKRQKLIDLFIQERQAKPRTGAGKQGLADRDAPLAARRDSVLKDADQKANQPDEPTPPTTELNGVVEKIDPSNSRLLSISIGSDAGLVKNQTLEVYRLNPAPLYLGKIRVIDVSSRSAVAQRVGNLPAGAPTLTAGDKVTSSLAATDKKGRGR